jgi:hypothetical protein
LLSNKYKSEIYIFLAYYIIMGATGSRILKGAGAIGSTILGGLNKAKDFVGKVYNTATNLPYIGNIIKGITEVPIPYVNLSAKQLGDYAGKGIDIANSISDEIKKPRSSATARLNLPPIPNRLPLPPLPRR